MIGKHSQEGLRIKQLEETIRLKDREIKDIKASIICILETIKELNEGNEYHDSSIKKNKISELCKDTISELWIDEFDENYESKKIELPTTC